MPTTPLTDYVGHQATGRVFCDGHVHEVRVKFTQVVGDKLKTVTVDDAPWCDMDPGLDNEGWTSPLWDDVPYGESPILGFTEETAHELELDPA